MCTLVILHRPNHDWPLIVTANRDEMRDRPWSAPARHWDDRPNVIAGRDDLAGGTWLGMNDDGLVAGILNRRNALGPAPDKRSRGELPLEALDHAEACEAARALGDIDPMAYRAFNMVIADIRDAYWIACDPENTETPVRVHKIEPGVSMVTASDMNDTSSDRIAHHLPRFRAAPAPDPGADEITGGDWFAWQALMADSAGWDGAMAIDTVDEDGKRIDFGTVSSSLIALGAPGADGVKRVWRFAAGMPGSADYNDVVL